MLTRRHDLTRHHVTVKCKDFQPQSSSVQIQPGEENLATAEQSTSVQIQPGKEELAPAEQSTAVQIQTGEEELAITSFTAIAPEGVEFSSTQFYQFK